MWMPLILSDWLISFKLPTLSISFLSFVYVYVYVCMCCNVWQVTTLQAVALMAFSSSGGPLTFTALSEVCIQQSSSTYIHTLYVMYINRHMHSNARSAGVGNHGPWSAEEDPALAVLRKVQGRQLSMNGWLSSTFYTICMYVCMCMHIMCLMLYAIRS